MALLRWGRRQFATDISLCLYKRMLEAQVFRTLADPTRRAMFEALASGERSVSELTRRLSISQPAVSQHLGALRRVGLVRQRRAGRFTLYQAEPAGLSPLIGWIDRYRAFWPERLQRLRTVLEDFEP